MNKVVNVSAAVLTRPDGTVLLGQRAAGTFYPGYWEFPGGKVEAGETPRQALVRELREELGIDVLEAYPWLMREHVYEHAHVRLHFFEVPRWQGALNDHVHAALAWQHPGAFDVAPMLPANGPILKSLCLPRTMGITASALLGMDAQLAAIETAIDTGCRLIQVREKAMSPAQLADFVARVRLRAEQSGTLVIVNASPERARQTSADGVHLDTATLLRSASRPAFEWVGASCHNRAELEKAASLELDYALLGPVGETASHPGQPGIGWQAFETLASGLPIPVLALGGLSPGEMHDARRHGAHGIAAIRSMWSPG